MSRPPRIAALPTTYGGILFRSRLESKYACLFDLLGWQHLWSYEAVDLPARPPRRSKIPDFLLSFAYPVLIECKPAVTLQETNTHRRALIHSAQDWLCVDAERSLRELDESPDAADDLQTWDNAVAFIEAVRARGDNGHGPGRRALVAGSQLHIADGVVGIDDVHTFVKHDDHVGLAAHGWCLVCGHGNTTPLPPDAMLAVWREASNITRWNPNV